MEKIAPKYIKELSIRVVGLTVLTVFSFVAHTMFLNAEQHEIGAFFFITIFTSALLFYYINLFDKKTIHKIEFAISIIFIYFLTISLFATMYEMPCTEAKDCFYDYGAPTNLTLSDSLYFSTTTITTLGYGDITPRGVFRYFAMAEVILGIIYMGIIIYFLTRVMRRE
jgi:voltage-gated potassium channel Kch